MKRKMFLAASFIFTAFTFAHAQTAKNNELEQQFIALQRAQDDAEGKKDIAALDRIFSDDFIFVAANGSIYDKKKFLEDIKSDTEPAAELAPDYEDFKVRSYGKTAVANYLLVVTGKDKDGKPTVGRYRMSAVWVKQKGNWRMANIHATRVRP
ncbi:MAG TPA: nuclear transport factor 2 family protein [Pyrinomonadaceae bacterium]|jgi:ketosteroid isomerase-like protein|nr:nuclear transport factor 2 family protein [Pyrinomonadaceae bacterium]